MKSAAFKLSLKNPKGSNRPNTAIIFADEDQTNRSLMEYAIALGIKPLLVTQSLAELKEVNLSKADVTMIEATLEVL